MIGALAAQLGGNLLGQGIGAYMNWRSMRQMKPVNFAGTEYGKHLKGIADKGAISGTERMNMLGNAGKTAYNQAGIAQSQLQGNLINSGMEGSIAGQRAKNELNINASNQISNAGTAIDMANEETKRGAMEQYQQQLYQNELQKDQWNKATGGGNFFKSQAFGNFAGGAAQTAGSMLGQAGGQYLSQRANTNMLDNIIGNIGDFDMNTAQGQLDLLKQIQAGGGDYNQYLALRDMFATKP